MNETKLEEFLTIRGLSERFKDNYHRDKYHVADSYEKFLDWYGSRTGAISAAFTWSITPEGFAVWFEINTEWESFLMQP